MFDEVERAPAARAGGSTPTADRPASVRRRPKPPAPVDQRTGRELLKDYRDVIAEHIDPDGTHLQKKPDNLQSGGGLGTKLGWREVDWVFVARSARRWTRTPASRASSRVRSIAMSIVAASGTLRRPGPSAARIADS